MLPLVLERLYDHYVNLVHRTQEMSDMPINLPLPVRIEPYLLPEFAAAIIILVQVTGRESKATLTILLSSSLAIAVEQAEIKSKQLDECPTRFTHTKKCTNALGLDGIGNVHK